MSKLRDNSCNKVTFLFTIFSGYDVEGSAVPFFIGNHARIPAMLMMGEF